MWALIEPRHDHLAAGLDHPLPRPGQGAGRRDPGDPVVLQEQVLPLQHPARAAEREEGPAPDQVRRPPAARSQSPTSRLKAAISRSNSAASSSNSSRQYSGLHCALISSYVFPCCSTHV